MRTLTIIALTLLPSPVARAESDDDFFENKVRPVLADHCFKCHGEKKSMAGLRLDHADGLTAGSDGGPVVDGTNVDASKLIQSVRRTGEYAMPPDKPLAPEQVKSLEEWVRRGAKYPQAATAKAQDDPLKAHWAFQPVTKPTVPAGPDGATPIDRFLLEKLHAQRLDFAPEADRRTLLKRLSFDLTGLPPTAEELEAFAADPDPLAYEKAVDRLLASPHYGERWGRFWLDIARYADSKGYVFQEDRAYPYAYTYRDYVINSFNDDKPYDRFVTEQLAADRMDLKGDVKPLAALGFLTLGRRFANDQHAIIDDRIDVVTRGFLGLTVQCARCHDHKFDPISAADYYALYGVFASTTEPKDLPILMEAEKSKAYLAYEKELEKREADLAKFLKERYHAIQKELRTPESIAEYLAVTEQLRKLMPQDAAREARVRNLRANAFQRYLGLLNGKHMKPTTPLWALWFKATADENQLAAVVADPPLPLPEPVKEAFEEARPKTVPELAKVFARFAESEPEFKDLFGELGPLSVPESELAGLLNRKDRTERTKFQRKIDGYRATNPQAPPRAMVVVDLPQPMEPVVFIRGNPGNRGAKVTRRAPGIIDPAATEFKDGSGRLELAARIADPNNPLTARVMVNRVWQGHFGRGLVTTPSDFGVRADAPTHPELLDHLASEFVEDGWSVKKLHRQILLTRAYRQSADNPSAATRDPENALLGRMTPKRKDFEAVWDSLLSVSGRLDRTLLGRSVDILTLPSSRRRAVYASIDRQNLPATFRTFDFASPDAHSSGRFVTTVPQQALFFLNAPFVVEQSKALAARPEVSSATTPEAKVKALVRLALLRDPAEAELARCAEFLKLETPEGSLSRLELLAQTLLMSNEFLFVD